VGRWKRWRIEIEKGENDGEWMIDLVVVDEIGIFPWIVGEAGRGDVFRDSASSGDFDNPDLTHEDLTDDSGEGFLCERIKGGEFEVTDLKAQHFTDVDLNGTTY
jgi:hypothetical protein